jgi:hypothetical protein
MKLEITDQQLQIVIAEVAPKVRRLTGWDLGLETLGCRALPRDRGYEEILLGRLEQVGIHDWEALMPDFLQRMIEYMIEQNTLAAYMPGAEEILVIRENVDDSNLDGLKLVLGHELAHRGQHLAHGNLFLRVDELLREALEQIRYATSDYQQIQQLMEQIQPVMTLLESHAHYIQHQLKQIYYPEASIETQFNLATLLLRMVGARKMEQYTAGLPEVAAAAASGSIESLYAKFKD